MKELFAKIADSELEVLKLLWENNEPMSMPQIRSILIDKTGWTESTIKTLLYRLCDKEVVIAEKKDVFYYRPLITESQYNEYATATLIDKLYNGSAKNLLASLIGSNKLNDEDIQELTEMFKIGEHNE